MTALESLISELRKLHAAATPGPWEVEVISLRPRVDGEALVHLCKDGDFETLATFEQVNPPDANAALGAAMRNALPTILDALEAAEQRAETLRGALEKCKALCEEQLIDRDFSCVSCGGCFGEHAQNCQLNNAIAEAERALKGEANGGG